MFFKRLDPITFSTLVSLLCNTQGLPGDGGGGGGTPPVPPGTPPAAGAAAPQPPPAAPPQNQDPAWLPERIAQAKRNAEADTLKALGVTNADEAKQLLDAGRKAVDAGKTAEQRAADAANAKTAAEQQANTYRDALSKRATAELAKLPQAAQDRIKALAGDDPVKILEGVDLAIAMGAPQGQQQPPPPAGGGQQQGKPPPVTPPANTTNAQGAPPSAPTSPPNHLAVWEDMQAKNPMAASQYYLTHKTAIQAAQQQRTKT